jgi:hypothetical protein
MSTNYDMEPITTPPWWPGIIALLVVAAILLAYVYAKS